MEQGRVKLSFTPPDEAQWCQFQTSRDNNRTWFLVRGGEVCHGEDEITCYDYEAPLGVPSWYRVVAYRRDGELLVAAADYIGPITVTPPTPGTRIERSR
jgi:hypothetical protein